MLEVSAGEVTLSHTSVFEQVGEGTPVLIVETISGHAEIRGLEIVYSLPGEEDGIRKNMERSSDGDWVGVLPGMSKGKRLRYYFEALASDGEVIRIPEEKSAGLLIKYKGEVSSAVLVFHVIFMFGAFFFMIEAALSAIGILSAGESKKMTILMVRWLIFFTFIGGWPLGFILNRQRFGPVWEGFPFGYDITDNKTQIMFLLWAVVTILSWSSFIGKGEDADRIGRKGFAVSVLAGFSLSLVIFLIPHSL